jgi:hypothetical protein
MGMRGPVPGPKRDLRSDIVDLEANLEQARNLARIFYWNHAPDDRELLTGDRKLPTWLTSLPKPRLDHRSEENDKN